MHKILLSIALFSSLQAAPYDHKFDFGAKTSFYNYTERDDNDQILDTEKSNLFDIGGVYGSYDYKLKEIDTEYGSIAHYLNLYASVTAGDTDYTGSLLGSNEGFGSYTSTTANTFYDYQINLKRVQFFDTSSRYILVGFGYKEWERELSTSQVETYKYKFIQLAVGGETRVYKDISLGIDITAQYGFNAEMDASFSGGSYQEKGTNKTVQSNPLNETFNLGDVYSYKVAAPLVIPIDEGLSFTTKLEYEFTSYGKSEIVTVPNYYQAGFTPTGQGTSQSFYEPASQQKNWHLYAGLQLLF